MEAMLEADFYGKNDEYDPSKVIRPQRPWYEAKAGLTCLFNEAHGLRIAIGGCLDRGGENWNLDSPFKTD